MVCLVWGMVVMVVIGMIVLLVVIVLLVMRELVLLVMRELVLLVTVAQKPGSWILFFLQIQLESGHKMLVMDPVFPSSHKMLVTQHTTLENDFELDAPKKYASSARCI